MKNKLLNKCIDISLYLIALGNYFQFVVFNNTYDSYLSTYTSPCLYDATQDPAALFLIFSQGCDISELIQRITPYRNPTFLLASNTTCIPESMWGKRYLPCEADSTVYNSNFNLLLNADIESPNIYNNATIGVITLIPAFFVRSYVRKNWVITQIGPKGEKPSRTAKYLALFANITIDLLYTGMLMLFSYGCFLPFENNVHDNIYAVYAFNNLSFSIVPLVIFFVKFIGILTLFISVVSHIATLSFTALKNDWHKLRNPRNSRSMMLTCSQKTYFICMGIPMGVTFMLFFIGIASSKSNFDDFIEISTKHSADFFTFNWSESNLYSMPALPTYLALITSLIVTFSVTMLREYFKKAKPLTESGTTSLETNARTSFVSRPYQLLPSGR